MKKLRITLFVVAAVLLCSALLFAGGDKKPLNSSVERGKLESTKTRRSNCDMIHVPRFANGGGRRPVCVARLSGRRFFVTEKHYNKKTIQNYSKPVHPPN